MYHIRYKGTHYQAGYNYGERLYNHGIVINKCPTFDVDDNRISFALKSLNIYNKYYPEIVDEIKGFCDGNRTDFNFMIGMLFTMYCYNTECHCSCFAYHNNDDIVFGRNSDFLVSLEKLYANVIYKLDNHYSFTGNTTAFIEIEDGINEYGLACGLTFIPQAKVKPGINIGMMTRYILEKCRSVDEAIIFIKSVPISSGGTLTLADKFGNIKVVEMNIEEINIISSDKYVYATNIFVSDKMSKYNLIDFDNWKADIRYNTMKEVSNIDKSISFSKELLSGKYGFMCQYDRLLNADTVWSVIYDIKNSDIYRVEGNPSRKEYKIDKRFVFKI